jgi:hypothetical protein
MGWVWEGLDQGIAFFGLKFMQMHVGKFCFKGEGEPSHKDASKVTLE